MIACMRTTLVIDDHVLREAKRQALEAGLSVSEFTTLALRETLRKRDQPERRARFSLPTYGSGPRHDSSAQQLADLRDEGR
jgi:hypothetical protein